MDIINPYTEVLCAELNMDLRELKALELAARAKIVYDGNAWSVPSQASPSP
jgi:hypothetical protein